MAKQTFSVGQTLTAAQMTSLQQTAMLGGAASNKTASYTLVAADAGTAISMSSASATTITVNTGLFAAGDTVNITNLGAGVCTITAGTATVNTSASLALAQYESGTLDFTSTSAAIFIKGAGAGGGGLDLLSTTTMTGSTLTISSISQDYDQLMITITDAYFSAGGGNYFNLRANTDTGNNYPWIYLLYSNSGSVSEGYDSNNYYKIARTETASTITRTLSATIFLPNYTSTGQKIIQSTGNSYTGTEQRAIITNGKYTGTSAISSLTFYASGGTMTAGTIKIYGVK